MIGGIGIDVTDFKLEHDRRIRLEREMQQTRKMAAVGQLAGGVAHDFNNVLVAILGNVALALSALEPGDDLHDTLLQVRTAARRAASLTEQLLAFSRNQPRRPTDLDLNALIRSMLEMLRRLVPETIGIETSLHEGRCTIEADRTQIDQVLMNLVVNARDAVGEGGRIAIRTDKISLDEQACEDHPERRPGSYLVLSVADDGCGMTAEVRSSLFEPFFTTKEVGAGTGLGLSAVHGIVNQHGGWIEVDSEPGEGARFDVFLPAVDRLPQRLAAPPPRQARSSRPTTILVADDETLVLEVTRRVLTAAGHKVITASDGVEAVDLFDRCQEEIGVVVLDVAMPRLTGSRAFEKMRAHRPDAKVLFVSGYDPGELRRSALRNDPQAQLLNKPYTSDELLAAVESGLGSPIES